MTSDYSLVKCDNCGYVTRTTKEDEYQCPRTGGGCGKRVKIKGNVVKV